MQNKRLLSIGLASAIVGILIMTTDNSDKQSKLSYLKQNVYTEKDEVVISHLDDMMRQESIGAEQAYLANLNFVNNDYWRLAFSKEVKTIFTPSQLEEFKSADYLYAADASLPYTNYLYGVKYAQK